MNNETKQIQAVSREVGKTSVDGKPAHTVVLAQTYETDINDLWDAVTNAERLPRWFAVVSGNLELNGRFQVKDNAGGTISRCDAPNAFDASWEFGGGTSWIEVRLEAESDQRSRLQLTHIAHPDDHWKQYGPGAVGIGWDLSLLGMNEHLATGANVPEEIGDWGTTPAAIEFMRLSGKAWIEADIASGENEADARTRGTNTINFYTGTGEG